MQAIVYYSLDGHVRNIAKKISELTGADLIELIPKKSYPTGKVSKLVWGGKAVVFGDTPPLEAYEFDPQKYETIILGTPVWAGSFTPPVKTFLNDNKLTGKKIALFFCSKSGNAEPAIEKYRKELPGCEITATLNLTEASLQEATAEEEIKQFCAKM